MKTRLNQVLKNLRLFSNVRYRSDLLRQTFRTILTMILVIVSCLIMGRLSHNSRIRLPVLLWILSLVLVAAIFLIRDWILFYHAVVLPALKIENIRSEYALIDTDKMTDFRSALDVILELISSSLKKEYSSSLLQKQAQLDAMQSQINPHFLYNTLDTIRGYAMMEEAPITSDMVELLSRLFRYMISQKIRMVTLRQELGILYDYIKIMEYRVNKNIVVMEKIDPDLPIMNYQIPKLIIQPIVENAIKHGFEGLSKEFVITISIFRTQSCLVVSIADNGKGMPSDQLKALNQKLISSEIDTSDTSKEKKKGSGIALTNVNSRIKLMYGDAYGVFAYSTLGKGSEFQIRLPYTLPEDK